MRFYIEYKCSCEWMVAVVVVDAGMFCLRRQLSQHSASWPESSVGAGDLEATASHLHPRHRTSRRDRPDLPPLTPH